MAPVTDITLGGDPGTAIASYALPDAVVVARPIGLTPGPPARVGRLDCPPAATRAAGCRSPCWSRSASAAAAGRPLR